MHKKRAKARKMRSLSVKALLSYLESNFLEVPIAPLMDLNSSFVSSRAKRVQHQRINNEFDQEVEKARTGSELENQLPNTK